MDIQEISARELRERQADVLNQIAFGNAHFIVTRHGKESAVLISLEEFQFLQKTMEYLEDKSDIADAQAAIKAVKRQGARSLKQFAKELGIDI